MLESISSFTIRETCRRKRSIVDIEYVKKFQAPESANALVHDAWISTCRTLGDTIIVDYDDSKVYLWNNQVESTASLSGHNNPLRYLAFIHSDEGKYQFISGSHQRTIVTLA